MAGGGDLPRLLAEKCRSDAVPYVVITFPGSPLDWTGDHPCEPVKFEKFGHIFKTLRAHGCTRVAFAGGMARPRLNPARFDRKFLSVAPTLLSALKGGDDATLRAITKVIEDEGFEVISAHSILDQLIAQEGVLTKNGPSEQDRQDAARAAEIVDALGAVDVGQGAVVAQGICLAVESIQGTDRMLQFVAETADAFRTDPDAGQGVFYKGIKPQQDKRLDVPTIGPDTIAAAANAGLAGIVVEAGAIQILDREKTVALADQKGLFLWARAKEAASL
jgi:DUF1009 family protein